MERDVALPTYIYLDGNWKGLAKMKFIKLILKPNFNYLASLNMIKLLIISNDKSLLEIKYF